MKNLGDPGGGEAGLSSAKSKVVILSRLRYRDVLGIFISLMKQSKCTSKLLLRNQMEVFESEQNLVEKYV
jgi:hypothetical protein